MGKSRRNWHRWQRIKSWTYGYVCVRCGLTVRRSLSSTRKRPGTKGKVIAWAIRKMEREGIETDCVRRQNHLTVKSVMEE